ncbi:hypothetical protein HRR83_007769 [Exophiala dermatitidis]|uniref:Aldehyde dehydrogenase domain-containing protein n=1 Tax=Exophiala dermatitidis TaxID=5970 RepID=A0AAN6ESJ1_EXODE|nr:hypothetical protein HRR75_006946 [Exophiala dermatitidis]KAJ4508983.1 hypothetical protein HRR74_007575 [Exophiala dermatitidis]KAJ4510235.1 hypothetical protein HRR73_007033 [Exophiala dermatitidis]KAJ4539248.1 hypothetical protein HRR77_006655 [Exophiala dermatitidis]KAJ4540471.1 hypothetical protein HRR76_003868 [Exophiala dermatitidis]
MAKPFSGVRAAAVDGRAHNPYYRKTQLKKLHDRVVENLSEIQRAIELDTGHRAAEIKAECWLALQCLVEGYNSVDPARELAAEYSIANQQDAPKAHEPVGIVLIEPAMHTFLFSLISALAPAIVAGNCVIVRVEQTILRTPPLVLGLIEGALDRDIIQVTYAREVPSVDIGHRYMRVLQNGPPTASMANDLVSRPQARVAAIVERDADLDKAAELLVVARLGLGGKSPYGPDLVLVNEWVVKEFLAAVARHSAKPIATTNGHVTRTTDGFADKISKKGLGKIVTSGMDGTVLELTDRDSTLAQPKLREKCLVVHAVSSIDDAIDVSNGFGRLAAAYVFTSKPEAAKYICQFVDSAVSFVNHIPTSLLFGPVRPEQSRIDPRSVSPYDPALFTLPKPQYVSTWNRTRLLDGVLLEDSGTRVTRLEAELAAARLPEVQRLKNGHDLGFFEQGIVTGGVVVLLTVVTCAGFLVYSTRGRLQSLFS